MRHFVLTAVLALCLPLMAQTNANRNALSSGPVMNKDFQLPATVAEQKAEDTTKENTRTFAAKLSHIKQDVRKVAETGTSLPAIVASVYDYSTGAIGMYKLPETVGGEMTLLTDEVSSYYGGTLSGTTYYACHDGRFEDSYETSDPHGYKIQAYNVETWAPIGEEIRPGVYRASDLAISPADGMGYAFCDVGSWMFKLYRIDMSTGLQTALHSNTLLTSGRAVCFDEDGTLYAVNNYGGFGTVDMTTGRLTEISSLNLKSDSAHGWSMTYDPNTGKFLFMYNGTPDYGKTQQSVLYSIVPVTGEFEVIAEWTGKCITSIAVLPETVEANAPAGVSSLAATFANGLYTGTVAFTMPSELYDGTPASGFADWYVYDGDELLSSGQANYGEAVTTEVIVAKAGMHTISAVVSNAAGYGKKERVSVWVGPDIPKAPSNISVDYDEINSVFTVTWDAVTDGANGGYVNTSDVTYTVVRMPAGVTVASGVSATSITDKYAPTGISTLYYDVTAAYGQSVSATASSLPITTGYMELPYDMAKVSSNELLNNWYVIDVNNDGSSWQSSSSDGIYYHYDSNNSADDWAITPPMKSLAGNDYKVHVVFKAQSTNYPERVEVKAGYGPTVDAMTIELLPPTVISDIDKGHAFDFTITPEQDGKLYVGFHAVSNPDCYYLKITELTISAPANDASPVAPVISTMRADVTGALKVSGSVTVPKVAEDGSSLATVTKVEITRDGEFVATINNPVPGSTVEFNDNAVPAEGKYVYTAYAYNGEYRSYASADYAVYVGVNIPGEATKIIAKCVGTDRSEVTVTWATPEIDIEGYPLNGEVTYNLEVHSDNSYYNISASYDNIRENSFTFKPIFESGLDYGFVYVKVSAVNSAGKSWAAKSNNVYVGAPIVAPFKESFPNYTLEHPWGDGESNGPQLGSISDDELSSQYDQYNGWNRMVDSSFQSADGAQDGDNGFAGMFGWSYSTDTSGTMHNEYTELISPVIDLSAIENPKLTFYTYNWCRNGLFNHNTIDVYVITEDGERHEALNLVIGELGTVQDWMYVMADLSEYTGQLVGIIFKGTIRSVNDNGYNWILLDNIRVEGLPAVDLSVSDIKAPVQAAPNEPFTIQARVTNLGILDSPAYKAVLKHNGVEVASQNLGGLGSGKFEVIEFEHSLSVQDPIGNVFTVSVVSDTDEVVENNESEEVTVARNLKLLPEPAAVYYNPEYDRLEWLQPDYASAVPAAVLEDFESYPCYEEGSFLTEAGDWIFIDEDVLEIGGMINESTQEMLEYPGIPNYSKQSWWIQSRLFEDFNDTYYGYDESLQYLANMYVVNETHTAGAQQDDWAITPELCGSEQLITLWARSYYRNTPETVEFLYSDGSTAPSAFKLILRVEELPGDWTQYALVVPEGARRFAIRGCSYAPLGTTQIFIDNVSYYPAYGEAQDVSLCGYNVYCDNKLLNSTPVTGLEYVELPEGMHTYAVSAVYATGESRAVVAVEGSGAGLGVATSLSVVAKDGAIRISGLDGATYTVASVVGVVYGSGSGSDNAEVVVPGGVYIVKVANNAVKIVVK